MNSATSIVIGILVVVGIGLFVYSSKKPPIIPVENTEGQASSSPSTSSGSPPPASTTPSPTPPSTPTASGITMAQVALHNSRTSCWVAINGNAYDLTSWIPNHPGGEAAILSMCGRDGSAQFNGKHGSATRPNAMLAGFKLGALAQ